MALYKRKTYVIDPKFQLKISFFIALLFAVSAVIYPYIIHGMMTNIASSLEAQLPFAANELIEKRDKVMTSMIIWLIFLTSNVFLCSIFFTHKMAGPLFKLKNFLRKYKKDLNNEKVIFRKGDYFQDVADEYNNTIDGISQKKTICLNILDEILGEKDHSEQTIHKINQIRELLGDTSHDTPQ